jgi:hypothetical protein
MLKGFFQKSSALDQYFLLFESFTVQHRRGRTSHAGLCHHTFVGNGSISISSGQDRLCKDRSGYRV